MKFLHNYDHSQRTWINEHFLGGPFLGPRKHYLIVNTHGRIATGVSLHWDRQGSELDNCVWTKYPCQVHGTPGLRFTQLYYGRYSRVFHWNSASLRLSLEWSKSYSWLLNWDRDISRVVCSFKELTSRNTSTKGLGHRNRKCSNLRDIIYEWPIG